MTRPRSGSPWSEVRSRGPSNKALIDARELIVAVVLDHDPTAATRPREPNLGSQRLAQVFLDALDVRIGIRGRLAPFDRLRVTRLTDSAHELLGLPNGETLVDHHADHPSLALRREPTNGAGVTFRQLARRHRVLDGLVQVQEAQGVGDRRPGASNAKGQILLGERELFHELAVGT